VKDPKSKDLSSGIRAIWRTLLKKTTFLHTRLTLFVSLDSLSTQVVSAAKLPILNPNEFDFWKIRIEQYFLMTDYLLWEVILNGDSPVPTIVVEGNTKQNLAFVSSSNIDSTTDLVSAAASGFAVYAKLPIDVDDLEEMDLRWQMAMLTMRARRKGHFTKECRSPKDSKRNGSYDWSYQAKEEPANFALMAFSPSSSSSDNELSPSKPAQDLSHTNRPSAPIIEDQPAETSILIATPKPLSLKSNRSGKRKNRKTCFLCKSVDHLISAAVPKFMVTRPRLAHPIVTKSKSPIRRHITHSQSLKASNSPPRVTVVQAPVVSAAQGMKGKWGNPEYALKDKGVIDSGCS
nr:hypothetical protein [Tanacetum cinerariifolium]